VRRIIMFIIVAAGISLVSGCRSPLFVIYREPAETVIIEPPPPPPRIVVQPQHKYYYYHRCRYYYW